MSDHVTFHDLKDASVFITGGGAGIGASLTDGFMAQGARVAFVQRSDASGFVEEMTAKHGVAPLFIQCDVTNIDALQQAVADAGKAHGTVTVLVNNAANDTRHDLQGFTPDQWDASMNVNLRPHFFTAQAVAPAMKVAGGGSIINFSSISYMMGNAGYPAYVASKAAITGLTRALARELGPDNIRVNALMPGWVLTQRQKDLWATPEGLAAHLVRQCLKAHLDPDDIIDATLFLASKASRMMTSQAMVVDGGVVVTG
ncbi:SDR family oxidoreductase [Pseudovibrio sp. Tun.PSC04-5.I4]|uniref:SDR family NAD(P)-dependent oxidoreductase n=1 Tax=Pseudovibrio sp. Tun.PSC04-5.I4 TaxID=1798213 RepID=UPI00089273BC|nr:SDR family oxidoreductase [Pseudovibrio sp. Tun.PSC04-5.I4]SDQ96754.1 NAD(P)-dependent dehydrogenase, short-chain alcohol dehydrogenase family [Pseudovibrio sp. Tun.PSC04-5.I4]